MSVAIYTKNEKQSARWQEVLRRELPDLSIEVYPSIKDFSKIKLLVCWKPYKGLIERFPNLKAIQSLGAGVDHIFKENTVASGIQVSKVVDHQLRQDMWEHALSIIMADMKNLRLYQERQKEKIWKPKRYKRMKDVSIGILGLGSIGSYVASRFAEMGFSVQGWSRSDKDIDGVESSCGEAGLKNLCSSVDYLVNILPLTEATRGILNDDLFSLMKPSSYLVNIGRGAHVVEEDLLKCLEEEVIRGAALDVFSTEPLPENSAFWHRAGVTITPHVASLTHIDSVYPQVVENVKRLEANLPLLNAIDVRREY